MSLFTFLICGCNSSVKEPPRDLERPIVRGPRPSRTFLNERTDAVATRSLPSKPTKHRRARPNEVISITVSKPKNRKETSGDKSTTSSPSTKYRVPPLDLKHYISNDPRFIEDSIPPPTEPPSSLGTE